MLVILEEERSNVHLSVVPVETTSFSRCYVMYEVFECNFRDETDTLPFLAKLENFSTLEVVLNLRKRPNN